MNTWGDAGDFRYFAPRLLELSTAGALVWPDIEIVFTKLAQAGWREWPERRAVAEFMAAFWSGTLGHHPARPGIGSALYALASAGADLTA
jgi:hypothetical protein